MTGPSIGWFTEADLPGGLPGIRISIEVRDNLFDEQSEWGHIQVLDTVYFGRLLIIDGIIQVTEKEEFIYHEMMVSLPALQHGSVKNVLIAGGGDGGALKHSLFIEGIERSTQVEIDDVVSEVCRKYIPSISGDAFEDPKTRLIYADAYDYMRDNNEKYDLIALDLTDPVPDGPAARLFTDEFFGYVSDRLADGGVVSIQCGSLLFQQQEIREQINNMKSVFKYVEFRNAVVPSYQLSSFGFIYASHRPFPELSRDEFSKRLRNTKSSPEFLNYDMYQSTKALPNYQISEIYGS